MFPNIMIYNNMFEFVIRRAVTTLPLTLPCRRELQIGSLYTRDQTSGSSCLNQNSSALSDWLPGATVQTLAETYVSVIIAVLSCLSQRGSSQGIDEPADLECRGIPALVGLCWA